jgi:hypothetical protein
LSVYPSVQSTIGLSLLLGLGHTPCSVFATFKYYKPMLD